MASRVEMVGPLGWGILCLRGKGSIHDQAGYLGFGQGQWRDSLSSAKVGAALNGYLEKSGKDNKKRCVKAQVGSPPTPYYTSWLKGHKREFSTASLDFEGLVPSYLPTLEMYKALFT